MPRPSAEQCRSQIESATGDLNVHHVSAITGIPYNAVKSLLEAHALNKATFFEQVAGLFGLHKKHSEASDLDDLSEEARDYSLEFQTIRLRKTTADLKEVELQARRDNLAPREDLERVLSHASQLASKHLDGLIPEIEMLLPDAQSHVIDAIATRIADARNAIAGAKLT